MNILVTGVAGFIGSNLAERLVREGFEVIGIDCFIDYYPRMLKEKNLEWLKKQPNFTFYEADLLTCNLNQLIKPSKHNKLNEPNKLSKHNKHNKLCKLSKPNRPKKPEEPNYA